MEPSSWGQVCVLGVGEGGSLGLTLDFLSTPLWLQRHLNAQPPPPRVWGPLWEDNQGLSIVLCGQVWGLTFLDAEDRR